MDNLFKYGIAIDFFGNYGREGKNAAGAVKNINQQVSDFARDSKRNFASAAANAATFGRGFGNGIWNGMGMADRATRGFTSTIFNLRNFLIGGTVGYALNSFKNSIISTGMEMEAVFSRMVTSMGGNQAKVIELLEWAKVKAVETPFDLPQVNNAIASLAMVGKAKSMEVLNESFTAIGDFAAAKSIDVGHAMQMVIKASFGNWESLADNTGIRLTTLATTARNLNETVRVEAMDTAQKINELAKSKQDYSTELIKFLGLMGKGGMERMVNTVQGSMSNIQDLVSNFMISMVGYSQVEGTLFNSVQKGLKGILNTFDKVKQTQVFNKGASAPILEVNRALTEQERKYYTANGLIIKQIALKDQLFRVGTKVGEGLTVLWNAFAGQLQNGATFLEQLIGRMDTFLSDFKNKMAPTIVFLALMKLQLDDFWTGFKTGYNEVFKPFLAGLKEVATLVYNAAQALTVLFGGEKEESQALWWGRTLGWIAASLGAIRITRMIMSPFGGLINGAKSLWGWLSKIMNTGFFKTTVGKSIGDIGGTGKGKALLETAKSGSKSLLTRMGKGFVQGGGLLGTAASFVPDTFGSGGFGMFGPGSDPISKMGFDSSEQYMRYREMAEARGLRVPMDADRMLYEKPGKGMEGQAAALRAIRDELMAGERSKTAQMEKSRVDMANRSYRTFGPGAGGGGMQVGTVVINVPPGATMDVKNMEKELQRKADELKSRKGE